MMHADRYIDKEDYDNRNRRVRRAFIVLTVLFFLVLVSFMILLINVRHVSQRSLRNSSVAKELTRENKARIIHDRVVRVKRCKEVFTGIDQVFEIFIPKTVKTVQQQHDIDKFRNRIRELKKACERPPKT
jgi:hypothetical protein